MTFDEATRVWVKVALNSFGGPAGQIAVMHRLLVDERKWISEHRFLHALNYCMLLPGPEAQQLATYIGWLLHGTRGGLVAGGLFILPGFLSILALSILYAGFHDVAWVQGLFFGLKAAVLAVVVEALLRIGRRVLTHPVRVGIAVAAFVALFFFGVPFPLVIASAAALGLVGHRLLPAAFASHTATAGPGAALDRHLDDQEVRRPRGAATARTAATWLTLWLAPVLALFLLLGPEATFTQVAVFFSKAATVTFGGAYAVLAYIAQEAVERFGWLRPTEMLDGLGMAETTPGPLVQVVQFVGFMATYRDPGALHPMLAGTLGAVLTTWVTFTPCFLWIFTGAPYIEWLRGEPRIAAALTAITAAVVGVIANLAVWFAIHVAFAVVTEWTGPFGLRAPMPDLATVDPASVVIAVAAGVAMLGFRAGMIPTLLVSALAGLAWRLTAGG